LKKKAVVLLMTLGFIGIITVLVLQTLSLSKKSFDELMDVKSQNQLLVYFENLQDILKNQTVENLKDVLLDQGQIPISDEKSGVNISFSCKALDSRIDLNSCVKSKECREIIKEYAKKNNLADSDFFVALLQDTVDPKEGEERMSGSRIIIDDKSFSDGCIVSFKTIQKIKDKYFHQIRDPKIYNIKEDDFLDVFYLSDKKLDHESNETEPSDSVKLYLDCYEKECQDKFAKINLSLNKTTSCKNSENNQSIQTKYLIQCNISQYIGDKTHTIVFKYNMQKNTKKRVVSIDEFF